MAKKKNLLSGINLVLVVLMDRAIPRLAANKKRSSQKATPSLLTSAEKLGSPMRQAWL